MGCGQTNHVGKEKGMKHLPIWILFACGLITASAGVMNLVVFVDSTAANPTNPATVWSNGWHHAYAVTNNQPMQFFKCSLPSVRSGFIGSAVTFSVSNGPSVGFITNCFVKNIEVGIGTAPASNHWYRTRCLLTNQ